MEKNLLAFKVMKDKAIAKKTFDDIERVNYTRQLLCNIACS